MGVAVVEQGVEEVDGDEVGEVLGAELRQLLGGTGGVELVPIRRLASLARSSRRCTRRSRYS
jgi:hypothetical protein